MARDDIAKQLRYGDAKLFTEVVHGDDFVKLWYSNRNKSWLITSSVRSTIETFTDADPWGRLAAFERFTEVGNHTLNGT